MHEENMSVCIINIKLYIKKLAHHKLSRFVDVLKFCAMYVDYGYDIRIVFTVVLTYCDYIVFQRKMIYQTNNTVKILKLYTHR